MVWKLYWKFHSNTSNSKFEIYIDYKKRVILENLYQLYFTYNDQYKKVAEKVAIDILTDIVKNILYYWFNFTLKATNFTAYDFFVDRNKIGASMQDALNQAFTNDCFSTIDFFQLRSGN